MNMQKMMKQAQEVQKKMDAAQKEVSEMEVIGTSGGGMVSIVVTGNGTAKKLSIASEIVDPDDTEVLEDLIVAAFNDAKQKAEDTTNDVMSKIMSGINLPPGMKLPF